MKNFLLLNIIFAAIKTLLSQNGMEQDFLKCNFKNYNFVSNNKSLYETYNVDESVIYCPKHVGCSLLLKYDNSNYHPVLKYCGNKNSVCKRCDTAESHEIHSDKQSHWYYTCCCFENYCNSIEKTILPKPIFSYMNVNPTKTNTQLEITYIHITISLMTLMLLFAFVVSVLFYLIKYKKICLIKKKSSTNDDEHALLVNFDKNLTLQGNVANGRFGSVWTADYKGESVAVKLILPQHCKHFLNEISVYNLPCMSNSRYILRFIDAGSLELSNDDISPKVDFNGNFGPCIPQPSLNNFKSKLSAQENKKYELNARMSIIRTVSASSLSITPHPTYNNVKSKLTLYKVIVFEYHPHGSLQNYLKYNQVNVAKLKILMKSLSAAVAFLHSTINLSASYKPPVAHRDLNSRNILINKEEECILCDFNLSCIGKYNDNISDGAVFSSDKSEYQINEVGTKRYMAPELFERALDLSDCITALKQVDIYALGMVLWEMSRMTVDIYDSGQPPKYRLPFEEETNKAGSFENIKIEIVRDNLRPPFPVKVSSKLMNLAYLKQTITECWERDSEARITAACVHSRMTKIFYNNTLERISADSGNESTDY
ncbi:hypothetical protein A3Q56_02388 [Intoshia linei]|uniref:receptor protein serine/threonine kinase n=1 Tax=Intoshia linei TaxID=1819745 RepID=A0A177B6D4_9BILA|nr:hypothetical protein A3Q56_02388 [Intoshia linei]